MAATGLDLDHAKIPPPPAWMYGEDFDAFDGCLVWFDADGEEDHVAQVRIAGGKWAIFPNAAVARRGRVRIASKHGSKVWESPDYAALVPGHLYELHAGDFTVSDEGTAAPR